MDTLVAQYTRPLFENEGPSQEEQLDLVQALPPLSLKFALPPIAQVSFPVDHLQLHLLPHLIWPRAYLLEPP